jgi:hypothetical protein
VSCARAHALRLLAFLAASVPTFAHASDDVLVELHFQPVPNTQIAIWIVDANGSFAQDVFVTQATGTLGIGNRPGLWNYLSSWRFPYGPRPQVLPVWAHARGKTYPALRYFDDDTDHPNSLGWHENSSSPEPYFCRPLSAVENETISTDTMTCPSPAMFQSDKGRFDGGKTTVYPPRNDLVTFEDGGDSPDVPMFAALNDLDAVTAATPMGDEPELVTTMIPRALAESGPLTAYIEVSLEHDENGSWAFDRETDHWVDPDLSGYGVEYLGQPSVVYRVEFDAMTKGITATDMYAGYGEWDGSTGELYPPDDGISIADGSGADRLRLMTLDDESFRFGVYSHGPGSGDDPTGGDDGGTCDQAELPEIEAFAVEPSDFDRLRVSFTIPESTPDVELRDLRIYYRAGDMPLGEDNVGSAIQVVPRTSQCSGEVTPGVPMWCEIDQLFGNFDYQVAMRFVDDCSNQSPLAADSATTPRQAFQTVEGACFVATAAWGAPWTERVAALRYFRDLWLRKTGVGAALVAFYYANSPPLAKAIARRPWARAVSRQALAPFADLAVVTTRGVSQ